MLIYPAIDLLGGRCVRLQQGDYSRETVFSDDPASVAKKWVELGADRLHLVDLDGAKDGKPVNGAVIRKIVEAVNVPFFTQFIDEDGRFNANEQTVAGARAMLAELKKWTGPLKAMRPAAV